MAKEKSLFGLGAHWNRLLAESTKSENVPGFGTVFVVKIVDNSRV